MMEQDPKVQVTERRGPDSDIKAWAEWHAKPVCANCQHLDTVLRAIEAILCERAIVGPGTAEDIRDQIAAAIGKA